MAREGGKRERRRGAVMLCEKKVKQESREKLGQSTAPAVPNRPGEGTVYSLTA